MTDPEGQGPSQQEANFIPRDIRAEHIRVLGSGAMATARLVTVTEGGISFPAIQKIPTDIGRGQAACETRTLTTIFRPLGLPIGGDMPQLYQWAQDHSDVPVVVPYGIDKNGCPIQEYVPYEEFEPKSSPLGQELAAAVDGPITPSPAAVVATVDVLEQFAQSFKLAHQVNIACADTYPAEKIDRLRVAWGEQDKQGHFHPKAKVIDWNVCFSPGDDLHGIEFIDYITSDRVDLRDSCLIAFGLTYPPVRSRISLHGYEIHPRDTFLKANPQLERFDPLLREGLVWFATRPAEDVFSSLDVLDKVARLYESKINSAPASFLPNNEVVFRSLPPRLALNILKELGADATTNRKVEELYVAVEAAAKKQWSEQDRILNDLVESLNGCIFQHLLKTHDECPPEFKKDPEYSYRFCLVGDIGRLGSSMSRMIYLKKQDPATKSTKLGDLYTHLSSPDVLSGPSNSHLTESRSIIAGYQRQISELTPSAEYSSEDIATAQKSLGSFSRFIDALQFITDHQSSAPENASPTSSPSLRDQIHLVAASFDNAVVCEQFGFSANYCREIAARVGSQIETRLDQELSLTHQPAGESFGQSQIDAFNRFMVDWTELQDVLPNLGGEMGFNTGQINRHIEQFGQQAYDFISKGLQAGLSPDQASHFSVLAQTLTDSLGRFNSDEIVRIQASLTSIKDQLTAISPLAEIARMLGLDTSDLAAIQKAIIGLQENVLASEPAQVVSHEVEAIQAYSRELADQLTAAQEAGRATEARTNKLEAENHALRQTVATQTTELDQARTAALTAIEERQAAGVQRDKALADLQSEKLKNRDLVDSQGQVREDLQAAQAALAAEKAARARAEEQLQLIEAKEVSQVASPPEISPPPEPEPTPSDRLVQRLVTLDWGTRLPGIKVVWPETTVKLGETYQQSVESGAPLSIEQLLSLATEPINQYFPNLAGRPATAYLLGRLFGEQDPEVQILFQSIEEQEKIKASTGLPSVDLSQGIDQQIAGLTARL